MTSRWLHLVVLSSIVCSSALTETMAAKFNRVMDIGKQAPAWKELRGVDNKKHSLSDLKNAKAIVVVFTCNHCPVAQSYEKRLIKLANEYSKKAVKLVVVSVSRYEADSLEAMKKRSQELKYPFAYLQDPTQKMGKHYGALWTPSVFLLDGKRRIVYMGGIDDSMYADKVERRYLKDAIDALLAGKPVEITETKPVGCPIDYE